MLVVPRSCSAWQTVPDGLQLLSIDFTHLNEAIRNFGQEGRIRLNKGDGALMCLSEVAFDPILYLRRHCINPERTCAMPSQTAFTEAPAQFRGQCKIGCLCKIAVRPKACPARGNAAEMDFSGPPGQQDLKSGPRQFGRENWQRTLLDHTTLRSQLRPFRGW